MMCNYCSGFIDWRHWDVVCWQQSYLHRYTIREWFI